MNEKIAEIAKDAAAKIWADPQTFLSAHTRVVAEREILEAIKTAVEQETSSLQISNQQLRERVEGLEKALRLAIPICDKDKDLSDEEIKLTHKELIDRRLALRAIQEALK